MLPLLSEHRRFFLVFVLAGLALRLLFLTYFPAVTDDSRIYANLATNWLQNGVYGQTQMAGQVSQIVPTDTRLPGYPAFLACVFLFFGLGNYKAVMLVQILFDLATCLLIADLARRTFSGRAAQFAFAFAALCPFLANSAAAVLTETLEIFFTALALDCAAAALTRANSPFSGTALLWAGSGLSAGACILLRPDGGVLLAAIALYLLVLCFRSSPFALAARLAPIVIVASFALAPLVPWTIRNLRTLHQFQPLAPRYANESDELSPRGFIRWVKTWIVDYASVEEIYWNVPGDKIDPDKLPARAFDSAEERAATLAILEDYNQTSEMSPALDARFGALAAQRIRSHPLRYYAVLPIFRAADMWLRPRTEILPPDIRWWEFNDEVRYSALAIGFGLLNLAGVGAALWAVFRHGNRIRWLGLLLAFVALRTALLMTLENPETRYTLECFPVVLALAASAVAAIGEKRGLGKA